MIDYLMTTSHQLPPAASLLCSDRQTTAQIVIRKRITVLHLSRQHRLAIRHGIWRAEGVEFEVVPFLRRPQLAARVFPAQVVVDAQEIRDTVPVLTLLLMHRDDAMHN